MRLDHNNASSGGGFSSWHPSGNSGSFRPVWPDAVAFREAVQSPSAVLAEPDLRQASVALDRMGMPLAYSGRFAIVFRLTTPRGERWALRCFTSPGEDGRGASRATRYRIIAEHTARMDNTFVPFRYIDRGIKVGSEWYPVVAMRWAAGEPLGRWVEKHLHDPESLRRLCGALSGLLERLEAVGIAHGDWQHDNLLISDEGARVTVVDYDGMFVPEFAGMPCPELGHPNYQHPDRSTAHFGPGLDRFACLVIETALLALARDPSLWSRFADGESMLFKKSDLDDPEASPAFAAVREVALSHKDEDLAESLLRLEDACRAGAQSTLLPAIAPGPAPTSLFANEVLTAEPVSAPVVTPLPPLGGKKWYQIPETAVALSAGRTRRSSARPTTVSGQTTYQFLSRLDAEETLKEEQWHLWRWRGGAVAFNTFLAAMLYHWLVQHGFPPFYFLWVLNFAGMGYGRWPRKRIYDELVGEIAKMENLVADRNRKIAAKGGLKVPTSAAEFAEERLKQTSVAQLIKVTDVGVRTFRTLRAIGVENLADVKRRYGGGAPPPADVSPDQMRAVLRWIEEQEMEAMDEYRQQAPSLRIIPVEVERLRHELAEFERHAAELKREQAQFPDASFVAYLRRLVGMNAAEAVPGGAAPPKP
jgi:hypothetical protein